MRAFRPLIHAVLALMFLVQGFSVAAASLPTAEAAGWQMSADPASPGHCACCNATCPDLLVCALGTLAMPAAFKMTLPAASHLPAERRLPAPYRAAPAGAAFRPPILLSI